MQLTETHTITTPKNASIFTRFSILLDLLKNPLQALDQMQQAYEQLFRFSWPGKDTIFIFDPLLAEKILIKDQRKMRKSQNYNVFAPLLGNGLVTAEQGLWRRQRSFIDPAFKKHKLEQYAASMTSQSQRFVKKIQERGYFSIPEDSLSLTYTILGETLFGKDTEKSVEIIAKAFPIVNKYLMQRVYIQWPDKLPLPGHRKYKKALKQLNNEVFNLIELERKQINPREESSTHLLSQLIHLSDQEGKISTKQLRDELMTMMLAGHETTANILNWAIYLLSTHPKEQSKLKEELDSVLNGKPATFEHYDQLSSIKNVVFETMRLYPSAYIISRSPKEPYSLSNQTIQPNDVLMISIWNMHRSPQHWESPDRFQPKRFSQTKRNRAFMPFGAGQRRCIGSEFATIEVTLILANLLSNIQFSAPQSAPKPIGQLTLRASKARIPAQSW